ncbi:Tim44/TimA family putative adaptor protein [Maritalea mediterranea]|uniref:Tim44/TimA family putative adaptor protein n=1 Tax=Maritalea mediterranea TaxID=2909667 RepID=A0ABS9E249_9HYPH|nr:Tim44/TimA family putative adaptor protein [Maritalea mediterranea]MCF4096926.1 Tim44/TimA family putative adaptor protein [Maritalea mediterranea]
MQDFLDPTTLIFLIIAVVVLFRLRSVLGTRTGHERPPYQRDDKNEQDNAPQSESAREQDAGNVIDLGRRDQNSRPQLDAQKRRLKIEAEIDRIAGSRENVAKGLKELADLDRDFSPKQFLDGAISAYEMIVVAFAQGDKKTLKMLLDRSIYDEFEKAINEREAQGQTNQFTFVGFKNVEIVDVEFENKDALITIDYRAQVVSAVRDKSGEVIEGDVDAIVDIADEWTFARPIKSRDPNWKLVRTDQLD